MNVRTSKSTYEGQEADFTRRMWAGVAYLFMFSLLSLAACGDGGTAVIKDAAAAPAGAQTAYFPTQFPSPDSAPAPHIEAF